ncbi:MBL fold metallo-hydrolase [Hydrogenophaga sp. OTU3427]|uniref:MBL fold metallo-hydrolase n=1 Tax=Hydrogenophaga sp. OTU3427 TaxID=3043856 RepID=UPI00313B90F1
MPFLHRFIAALAVFLACGAHATEPPMALAQVAPNTYYVQGLSSLGSRENQNFISNAGFVVGPQGVVVIDALGSPRAAERLTNLIRGLTPKPITHVIVTHYHADHIYGLQHFKALGARIVAHRAGLEYLNSETAQLRLQASRQDLAPWIDGGTRLVPADQWITGATTLTLAGLELRLLPVGPAHTPEDLTVLVPSENVLFAGDLVFSGRLPYVGRADSSHWIAALDALRQQRLAAIVPGHGPASTRPEADLLMTRNYLAYLRSSMKQAVDNMLAFDEAYAQTDWRAFEAVPLFGPANRMNAYNTYLTLEQEFMDDMKK